MTTTTAPKLKTDAQIARTKKYQGLIAVGLSPEDAIKAYRRVVEGLAEPEPEPEVNPLQPLLDAGFTQEEAQAILASGNTEPTAEEAKPEPTAQELAEALVVEKGFDFARGRVYVTPDMIESAVRVRKTGAAEIIASSGAGRTKAVLLFRTESGEVALQNLLVKA